MEQISPLHALFGILFTAITYLIIELCIIRPCELARSLESPSQRRFKLLYFLSGGVVCIGIGQIPGIHSGHFWLILVLTLASVTVFGVRKVTPVSAEIAANLTAQVQEEKRVRRQSKSQAGDPSQDS